MKQYRTGKATIATIEMTCPYCGQGMTDPEKFSYLIPAPLTEELLRCHECGKYVAYPAWVYAHAQ